MKKLTTQEAEQLIKMLKKTIEKEIHLPSKGTNIRFDVQGRTKKHIFSISLYRGKINPNKGNFTALIKRNNTVLLSLDTSPAAQHMNPDGQVIKGPHWHIYTEEYGRNYAYPAVNITDSDFVKNTLLFLEEFHVIEKPKMTEQVSFNL